jgi:predicted methyltransferase
MLVRADIAYSIVLGLIRVSVYAIEATVHAPTWEGVYGEIMKVLKPGGIVSILAATLLRSLR